VDSYEIDEVSEEIKGMSILEILRFPLIGGLSLLLDFVILIICKQYILPPMNEFGLYLATGVVLFWNYTTRKTLIFNTAEVVW
jgi:putative flippase GtrA